MKNIKNKLSILATVFATVVLFSATSCTKSSPAPTNNGGGGGTGPTPIDGFTSSDSIDASNLIAYFPFDGNSNDVKGNLTAHEVNITYGTGIRGQAYQGGDSTYATLVPDAAFSSLGSYTISLWYKLAAQPTAGDPGGLFFLSGTTNPNLLLTEIESYAPVSGDSVKIHHGFFDVISPAYQGFTMESYDTAAIGKWVNVVTTYDGSASTYVIYQNGNPIGNNSAFGSNVTTTQMWTDGTMTTPLGNLGWGSDAPVQIVIGTWPAGLYGVSPSLGSNGCFMGQMDELRVFNKALSPHDVAAIYLNGVAGR
jgi:Concanavalin A-like lectin/glucanases superfamily